MPAPFSILDGVRGSSTSPEKQENVQQQDNELSTVNAPNEAAEPDADAHYAKQLERMQVICVHVFMCVCMYVCMYINKMKLYILMLMLIMQSGGSVYM